MSESFKSLTYSIIAGDSDSRFTNSSDGIIKTSKALSEVAESTFKLTVKATDGTNSSTVDVVVTSVDKILPVITLSGAGEVTHEAKNTYSDDGASASDDPDGNVTAPFQLLNQWT